MFNLVIFLIDINIVSILDTCQLMEFLIFLKKKLSHVWSWSCHM